MADTISMALNILFAVIIFFGIFWGLIRGFKKSVSRFLFLLVCMIIALLIAAPITKALLNIQVSTSMTINGETIYGQNTLLGFLSKIFEALLGKEFVTTYPEFAEAIIIIPILLANLFIYIILFWLMKILLLPLNALLNHFILKPRHPHRDVMGFASMDNKPDYPNSDQSIQPLMDIYNQAETMPDSQPAATEAPTINEPTPVQNSVSTSYETPIAPIPTQSSNSDIGRFITKDDLITKGGPNGEKPPLEIVVNQVSEPETKRQIKKREKQERRAEKKEQKKTIKKHRLLGGLVGIATSAIVLVNVMLPIYGVLNILDTNRELKLEHITDNPTDLNALTNGIATDILKGYESSVLGKVSKTLGFEALEMLTFDKLTTATINGKEICLRKDTNAIIDTLEIADTFIGAIKTISDNGLDAVTEEQLTDILAQADTLVSKCEEIEFVDAMSNYILPVTLHVLKSQDIKFVKNDTINTMIIDSLDNLIKETGVNVFGEVHALIDVAEYLNEQNLLIKVIKNDYSDIVETINGLDEDFSTKLSEKLFGIETINSTLPDILKIGFAIFEDATHFGYTENTATAEEIKTSLKTLLANIIDVALTISDESSIYLTDNSLVALGELLNTVRNSSIMNTDTYNNLVTYATTQVKKMTTEVIPENFKDYFNNNLLGQLTNVTDWKAEMQVLVNTLKVLRHNEYGILGEIKEGSDLRQGYTAHFDFNEYVINNIGTALDTLEASVLFKTPTTITIEDEHYTTTSLIKLVSCIFTEMKEYIPTDNSITRDILPLFDHINENLVSAEHLHTTDSTFWEDEFSILTPLIIEVYNMSQAENFELTTRLGTLLDTASHGTTDHEAVLLGNDTTLQLMSKLLNTVKDSLLGEDFTPSTENTLNDSIYNLIEKTKDQLASEETKLAHANDKQFWETEIGIFTTLMDVAEKAETITSIDSASEIAADLDRLYTSRIIPNSSMNKIIASVLTQIKGDETTGIEGKINSIIDGIANDIVNESFWTGKDKTKFWETELTHIENLMSLDLADDGEYKVLDHLTDIGVALDKVIADTAELRASYLITEDRVNEIISTALNEIKGDETTGVDGQINSLIENISNDLVSEDFWATVTNKNKFWETELTHIQNLNDIQLTDVGSDYKVLDNLESIGQSIDNITSGTSALRSSYLITEVRVRNILSTAVADMKDSITDNFSITSMKSTIDSSIDAIAENIKNNTITSFETELGHLSTLAKLEITSDLFTFHEDYTAQRTALEEIGRNLDSIAYNTTEETTSAGKITKFNENLNSKIITRDIIVNIISSAFDSIKVTNPSSDEPMEQAINDLVDGVGTQGESDYIPGIKDMIAGTLASSSNPNDYVMSWERELSYVCILTQLSNNKTFTLNTAANDIGQHLDSLAFNVYNFNYADVKHDPVTGEIRGDYRAYYTDGTTTKFNNSLLITRPMLQNLVNTMAETIKSGETHTSITENSVKDELIDNLESKLNIDTFDEIRSNYDSYTEALTDLKIVYNQITTLSKSITDVNSYEAIDFSAIDTMLGSVQTLDISGVITTRHLAMLLVSKARTKLETDIPSFATVAPQTHAYLTTLANNYASNNTNTPDTNENYVTAKHFETIKDKLAADGKILVG